MRLLVAHDGRQGGRDALELAAVLAASNHEPACSPARTGVRLRLGWSSPACLVAGTQSSSA